MAEAARTLMPAADGARTVTAPAPEREPRPFSLQPVPAERQSEPAAVVAVAVVSPYPATRAGLRVLLEADNQIDVVGEAQSVAALEDALDGARAAVIVVDPAGGAGALPAGEHAPAVVMLGVPPEQGLTPAELSERAWGFLPPDADGAELTAAVLAVYAGLLTIHPSLAAHLLSGPSASRSVLADDETFEELTPRELEVLALLAEGIPNKTIALRLGISDHTVKFHVGALLGKLGASSRTEAVRTGLRRGLIAL